MSPIPGVSYQEVDQSSVPPALLSGKHGVILQTLFGPTDKPYKITTVDAYKSKFGGPGTNHPWFDQMRRALARGTQFYVQRMAMTAAAAASYAFTTAKLTVHAKDVGTWANGVLGINFIKGNGTTIPFKLSLVYADNVDLEETFTTAADGDIDDLISLVNTNSARVSITTETGYASPDSTTDTVYMTGGSEGAFADQAAKDAAVALLLQKFNDTTDIDALCVPGNYSVAAVTNLVTYAESRKDLMALYEIEPNLSPSAAITFAGSILATDLKSSYLAIYYSNLLTAWSTEQNKEVSNGCLLDVCSVWAYSDTQDEGMGRRKAPAGGTRGLIPGIRSFTVNMLSSARAADANSLADLGVNIVGSHKYFGPVVWGAKTHNLANSSRDNIHVRRTLIDLEQNLLPLFQLSNFEPMNPKSWRSAYAKAQPLLKDLESSEVIYPGWTYVGDQAASSIEDALYNKVDDLKNGIYKVKIPMVFVGYIETIDFTVLVNSVTTLFNS